MLGNANMYKISKNSKIKIEQVINIKNIFIIYLKIILLKINHIFGMK